MERKSDKKLFRAVAHLIFSSIKEHVEERKKGDKEEDAYLWADVVKEWDPKLHALMMEKVNAEKKIYDYILSRMG